MFAFTACVHRTVLLHGSSGFQRQLLLFARMGCRWFPTLANVWRTSPEREMAAFRVFVPWFVWFVFGGCGGCGGGRKGMTLYLVLGVLAFD